MADLDSQEENHQDRALELRRAGQIRLHKPVCSLLDTDHDVTLLRKPHILQSSLEADDQVRDSSFLYL